ASHAVAGRMTGTMNVLLAEADIPYTDLVEMDEINADMPQCDVALVVGANDVVNPAARTDKASPIYGMPIIDADKARLVFAIKRSKNPGFAGIDNEHYFSDRTWMLPADRRWWVVCRQAFVYGQPSVRGLCGACALDRLAEQVARRGARRALVFATEAQRPSAETIARILGRAAAGLYAEAVMHVPVE